LSFAWLAFDAIELPRFAVIAFTFTRALTITLELHVNPLE
jgi:hypothetical protein